MAYRVPQFITIEDKFMGTVTFRQLMYLIAAGGISFVIFLIAPGPVALFLGALVFMVAALLAFGKIGGVPFYRLASRFLGYLIGFRVYSLKTKQETGPKDLTETKLEAIKTQLEKERKQLKQTSAHTTVERTWTANPDNPYKNFPLPPFRGTP